MRIDILTLFPEMFHGVLGSSILKRAAHPPRKPRPRNNPRKFFPKPQNSPEDKPGIPEIAGTVEPEIDSGEPAVSYHLTDIRQFTQDKHQKVDQRPYGGGPGMVLQCQPIWDAVLAVESQDARPATRILMTPHGQTLRQPMVEHLAQRQRLLIIAGHYEGLDQRVIDKLAPMLEVSIGDYVLTGGELAAMVLIDAVVRLIPGVLGDEQSVQVESFSAENQGLLDHPHYTRPRVWEGMEVPPVLLSGDHARIEAWRREEAARYTSQRRPDLLGQPSPGCE